jgi:hypothetical protein
MRRIDKTWTKNPWMTVFPARRSAAAPAHPDRQPGRHQRRQHVGLDPSDDPRARTAWDNAIRTWDIDFLRDNPLAQFYLKADDVASGAVDAATTAAGTAAEVAKAANSLAGPRQAHQVLALRRGRRRRVSSSSGHSD